MFSRLKSSKRARLTDVVSRKGEARKSSSVGLASHAGRKVQSEDDCPNPKTIVSEKDETKLVHQHRRSGILRTSLRQCEHRPAHDRRSEECLPHLQDAE